MTFAEAFELALDLAISAPTEAQSERAIELAEGIAMELTAEQIEIIKSRFEIAK